MDWFIAVFVVPEVFILVLGFIAIIASLVGSGELSRLKPVYKPKGREVDPTYWGQYLKEHKETIALPASSPAIVAASSVTASSIALPALLKAPETVKWDKDWTGGPQLD